MADQLAEATDKATKNYGSDSASVVKLKKVLKNLILHEPNTEGVKRILGEKFVAEASGSYYQQEHKERFVRVLVSMAEFHLRIGVTQADLLFEKARRGHGITTYKKQTLERILNGPKDGRESKFCGNVKFTPAGRRRFQELLRLI